MDLNNDPNRDFDHLGKARELTRNEYDDDDEAHIKRCIEYFDRAAGHTLETHQRNCMHGIIHLHDYPELHDRIDGKKIRRRSPAQCAAVFKRAGYPAYITRSVLAMNKLPGELYFEFGRAIPIADPSFRGTYAKAYADLQDNRSRQDPYPAGKELKPSFFDKKKFGYEMLQLFLYYRAEKNLPDMSVAQFVLTHPDVPARLKNYGVLWRNSHITSMPVRESLVAACERIEGCFREVKRMAFTPAG
jgi:hypothetical protein